MGVWECDGVRWVGHGGFAGVSDSWVGEYEATFEHSMLLRALVMLEKRARS